MKQYFVALLGLITVVTGCFVVGPPKPSVQLDPKEVILGRGEKREFTASLTSGTAQGFTWVINPGEGSFDPPAPTGAKATYVAPLNDGEFKINVSAVGVEAVSAIATVTVAEQASATADFNVNAPLRQGTISPNGSKRYIVEIPSSLQQPLLKFEVGTAQPVTLKVFDANNQLLAQSSDKTFFTRGTSQSSQQGLEAQFINSRCDGPCVALPKTGSRYIVLIEAGNTQVNFRFDAYDDIYSDDNEPANDNCVTSDAPAGSEGNFTEVGAIETLGDVDCFNTPGAVTSIRLIRLAETRLSLQAEVTNLTTNEVIDTLTLNSGDSVTEDILTLTSAAPVKIVVRATDGRAGPTVNSIYNVVFK